MVTAWHVKSTENLCHLITSSDAAGTPDLCSKLASAAMHTCACCDRMRAWACSSSSNKLQYAGKSVCIQMNTLRQPASVHTDDSFSPTCIPKFKICIEGATAAAMHPAMRAFGVHACRFARIFCACEFQSSQKACAHALRMRRDRMRILSCECT